PTTRHHPPKARHDLPRARHHPPKARHDPPTTHNPPRSFPSMGMRSRRSSGGLREPRWGSHLLALSRSQCPRTSASKSSKSIEGAKNRPTENLRVSWGEKKLGITP